MMDNASIHRTRMVKEVLVKWGVGALYTSPYSPHASPVENIFGIIKRGSLINI